MTETNNRSVAFAAVYPPWMGHLLLVVLLLGGLLWVGNLYAQTEVSPEFWLTKRLTQQWLATLANPVFETGWMVFSPAMYRQSNPPSY